MLLVSENTKNIPAYLFLFDDMLLVTKLRKMKKVCPFLLLFIEFAVQLIFENFIAPKNVHDFSCNEDFFMVGIFLEKFHYIDQQYR